MSLKLLIVGLVELMKTALFLRQVTPVYTKKMTISVFLPVLPVIRMHMVLVSLMMKVVYTSGSVTLATLKTVQLNCPVKIVV